MKQLLAILMVLLVTGCSVAPSEPVVITNIDGVNDTSFIYTASTREETSNGVLWSSKASMRFYSHKRFAIGDTIEFVKKGR